jgi:hypothetical protein
MCYYYKEESAMDQLNITMGRTKTAPKDGLVDFFLFD